MSVAALLAFAPMHGGETLPRGVDRVHIDGGVALLGWGLPGFGVFPLPTGDVEWARGASDSVDVGVRYRTDLGLVHRLGPTLRVRGLATGAVAVGGLLQPSAGLAGSWEEGVDLGGDLSTRAAIVGSLRSGSSAWIAEVGGTVQHVLFEQIDGRGFTDARPWLASGDVAVEWEVAAQRKTHASVRLEAVVPLAPAAPFTVLGTYPRVVVGANFE